MFLILLQLDGYVDSLCPVDAVFLHFDGLHKADDLWGLSVLLLFSLQHLLDDGFELIHFVAVSDGGILFDFQEYDNIGDFPILLILVSLDSEQLGVALPLELQVVHGT